MRTITIIGICVIAMLAVFIPVAQGDVPVPIEESDYCKVPPASVRVTVRQDDKLPIYKYTIHNNYIEPVKVVELADADFFPILKGFWYEAKRITSPTGWRGKRIYNAETFYITYMLIGNSPSYYIKPDESLGEFTIKMPQITNIMKYVPYSVYFANDECATGSAMPE